MEVFPRSIGTAKADLTALGRNVWIHDLADCIEDDLELAVILAFQILQLFCQFGVAGENSAKSNKGAHDLDVHLDCTWTAQHARQHRDALFGEGVWCCTPTAPT